MNTFTVCTLENLTFYLLKCVQNMKLDNFVPFGMPQSRTVILQLMTELDISNKYRNSNT